MNLCGVMMMLRNIQHFRIGKDLYMKRDSILYSLFKSYIIIIIILLAIMFTSIFTVQKNLINNWMIENNNNNLEQANSYVDEAIFSTADSISRMFLQDSFNNANLSYYFFESEYSYASTKYIQDYLSSLMNSYNMIRNIAIYYESNNYIISPLANIKLSQYEFDDTFTKLLTDSLYKSPFHFIYVGSGNSFTSPDTVSTGDDNSKFLYFIRKIPKVTFSSNNGGAVIISINENVFYNEIEKYFPKNTEIILTSMDGTILLNSNQDNKYNDISFLEINNTIADRKNYIEKINGVRYLISFNKSTFSNFMYIALTPMNNIINNISLLIKILILITILTFIVGIVLSVFSARHNIKPLLFLKKACSSILNKYVPENSNQNEYEIIKSTIDVLSNRLSKLDYTIKEFSPILYDYIFIALFDKKIDVESIKNKLFMSGINFNRNGYIIVVFKIKKTDTLIENTVYVDCQYMSKEIEKIFNLYTSGEDIEYINTEFNNYYVYLLNIDPNNNMEKIFLKISSHLLRFNNIHLYMSISEICNQEKDIQNIYKQACEYIEYSFIHPQKFLFTKDVKKSYSNEDKTKLEHIIKLIIHASQTHNFKCIPDLLVQLENCVIHSNLPCKNIKKVLSDMVIRINNNSIENRIMINEIIGESDNLIEYSGNINEFSKHIGHVFNLLSDVYDKNQDDKNQEIIDKVKDYIKMNLTNNCISLECAADLLNISSAHLSRLFKKVTNENFVDYVMNEKLEYAKEQLISTALPVNSISKMIGYSNTQYFISKFKTKYGTTPNKYRIKNK